MKRQGIQWYREYRKLLIYNMFVDNFLQHETAWNASIADTLSAK